MNNLILWLDQQQIPYLTNEPMRRHTTFKTGGDAKLFITPRSVSQLAAVLQTCSQASIAPFILGNGSNLLVPDEGLDRAVIAIGEGLDDIRLVDDQTIEAGAGATLMKLCRFALMHNLSGLEFAYGIPGSVGGAAYMNAGAYGGEMKDVVLSVSHLTSDGTPGKLEGQALSFGYRTSAYQATDHVITSVTLRLQKGNKDEIEAKMNELLSRRKEKQPLDYPSAGSVFKRPEGYYAGALIEQCGLKGKTIGGAQVSEKHAGFIVNIGGATTKDVTDLIAFCQQTVFDQFGVRLEPEIKRI